MVLRIGVNEVLIQPEETYTKLVKYVRAAENYGVYEFWCESEAYLGFRYEPFVTLGGLAGETSKIRLSVCGLNPYHTNPVNIATSASTLNVLSNGRTSVGIGAGDRQFLAKIGVQQVKPAKMLKETIEVLKKLTAGEVVQYDGELVKIKGLEIKWKQKGRIPVYSCTKGPKNLEVAGEVADGLFITSPIKGQLDYAKEMMKKGADRVGRKLGDIDIIVNAIIHIADDFDVAYERAKKKAVFYPMATLMYPQIMKYTDITTEERGIIGGRLMEAAAFFMKKGRLPTEKEISLPEELTEKVVKTWTITGTPEDCIKRIKEYEGLVSQLCLQPFDVSSEDFMKHVGEHLVPAFAE